MIYTNMKELIKEKLGNEHPFVLDKIALHRVEGDDYYSIIYNYMGTGIHIPASDVDEELCEEEGIKIWKTWSYKS